MKKSSFRKSNILKSKNKNSHELLVRGYFHNYSYIITEKPLIQFSRSEGLRL